MVDWRRMPVSSGAVHRRHVFCSHGHVSGHVVLGGLPDALNGDRGMVSSSTPWTGPEPAWWRRGQPMQLTMAAVAEHVVLQEDIVMAAVAETASVEPAAAGDGAGDDKPAEPCAKRRKTHMPPEVKEWFCSLAQTGPRRSAPASQRGPSFFEHAHIDTPRRLLSHKTSGTALGSPRSLEPAAVLAPADIVSRVCSRVCCGAGVLAELLTAHLETLGVAYRFSTRQSRTFMRSLGYSVKKPKGELGKEWPEATTRTLRELCQQKIEWTLNDAGITDRSRIINIDETCCKMLPLLERGWLAGQHFVMDTRRNITVFLATRHLVPDVHAQLIFQGKTSAVEPTNHYPTLLTTSHSESRWTTTTLTAFLTWLDATVMNPDGSRTPWICFMDVCTVHVSHEFLALHRLTHAHIRLVCVPPNTTAVCQPLDRACMRPFKAALGRYSARCIGREIQHRPDDVASIIRSIAGMRSLIMRWTHDALKDIATMRHNTAAWSDIVCTDAEGADVLALATARHIAGTLFKHHRGLSAAELRTDADVDEVGDVPVHEDPPDVFTRRRPSQF